MGGPSSKLGHHPINLATANDLIKRMANVQVCGKTTFFHPHHSFVRPYTTHDNAPTYHTYPWVSP